MSNLLFRINSLDSSVVYWDKRDLTLNWRPTKWTLAPKVGNAYLARSMTTRVEHFELVCRSRFVTDAALAVLLGQIGVVFIGHFEFFNSTLCFDKVFICHIQRLITDTILLNYSLESRNEVFVRL